MIKICKNCGDTFIASPSKNKLFCSWRCHITWKNKQIDPEKQKAYQRNWQKKNREKNLEKYKERDRKWYARNRDRIIARNKKNYEKNARSYKDRSRLRGLLLKFDVIGHYSKDRMECCLCREGRWECLSIDHISGGGCKHRKKLGGMLGYRFYQWLKTNGYPDGYRVLCMNCQFVERERLKKYDTH